MSRTVLLATLRTLFLGALPFLIAACDSPTTPAEPAPGGGSPPVPPVVAATIQILTPQPGVTVGQTVALTAVVQAADGSVLQMPVSWSTGDTARAVVSAQGVLTARTAGMVKLSAAAGGISTDAFLQIHNVAPVITSLSPSSATRGSQGLEFTVSGSGFVEGALVFWNGEPRSTAVVDGTAVRASISAEDLLDAGTASVVVVNPDGWAGGSSGVLTFVINEPSATWVTYDLMGLEGEEILPAEAGPGVWVDEAGTEHPIFNRVISGALRIRSQPGADTQWEQVVTLAVVLQSTGEELRRDHYTWSGVVFYDFRDGSYIFQSNAFLDLYFRTRILDAESFVLYQVLETRAREEYIKPWVYVKQ